LIIPSNRCYSALNSAIRAWWDRSAFSLTLAVSISKYSSNSYFRFSIKSYSTFYYILLYNVFYVSSNFFLLYIIRDRIVIIRSIIIIIHIIIIYSTSIIL
jgi:hypothetical protein